MVSEATEGSLTTTEHRHVRLLPLLSTHDRRLCDVIPRLQSFRPWMPWMVSPCRTSKVIATRSAAFPTRVRVMAASSCVVRSYKGKPTHDCIIPDQPPDE
jgi:hypothetical protein